MSIVVGSDSGGAPAEDVASDVSEPAESSEEESGEDTSPPIKVGKSGDQVNEAFRNKVLQLINA